MEPDVPVTVMLEAAMGVAAVVVMVRADVPVGSEAGLKTQTAPAGKPLQVRSTAAVNPLVGDTVIVDVPDCPGPTTVTGVPPSEKSGVTTKLGQALTSRLASTEPNP